MGKRYKSASPVVSCVIGIVASWVILLVLIGVLSYLVLNEVLGTSKLPFVLGAVQFFAVAAGACLSSAFAHTEKKISCIITGSVFLLLEFSVALLVGDGIAGGVVINLVVGAAAELLVLYLLCRTKSTPRKRRKAIHRK